LTKNRYYYVSVALSTTFAPPADLPILWASTDTLVGHIAVPCEMSGQACVRVYGRKRKQTIGWLCHTTQSKCIAGVYIQIPALPRLLVLDNFITTSL